MKKTIYTIPGLGLDHRIFSRLDLDADEVVHLDWIEPEFGETLDHYAMRMASQITDSNNAILLGHSFGGMLALKIADQIHPELTIVVSAVKNRTELPGIFQILKWVPMYKLYSNNLRDKTLPYWSYFFGISSNEEQEFFKSMLARKSNHYREWAIEQVIKFDREDSDEAIIHVHGEQDKIFPASKLFHFVPVRDGDHFMIWKKPEKISGIINNCIHPAAIHIN